ncbi:ACSL1, partial [Symbiodinium sp. KB8]
AVHLHPELFSVENDLLTPTFKLKRPQAKTYFKDVIDNLYSKIEDNIGGKSGLRQ